KHWAPPKGFWRVARPETLLLSGVGSDSIPPKDYTQIEEHKEHQRKSESEPTSGKEARGGSDTINTPSELKQSGSGECYLDRWEQKEADVVEPAKELELPLSPRHEEAKRLLERARLKARSSHIRGDRPRRSHSDQRTSHGCSPTRVRFEDESEKEAESRYLDRVKQRGRPGMPKSKNKDTNTDSSSSGSEKSRGHRSVSMPPPSKQNEVVKSEETVVKEIIVLVKKCEACGSVVREPQPPSTVDPQNSEPPQAGSTEDARGKASPRWVLSNKPDTSTRPKASLTVTFAGAYVLGESKEVSSGWKSSGFGKLRRRSRKGESRLESGHGPYGPSWAQRRNSNPRNRVNLSRSVSFAPGSPMTLEPHSQPPSGELRESPTPSLPIKSALKSSSRNRSAAGQSTVQFQMSSNDSRSVRGPGLSRAEDLRAELLRAEHLKAEALWEENSDGSDGRPKLFLRRFFSSIGLNSVGRLVKGGRSSSMEQLSIPSAPRANSASPSPTRRPQPSIRIQRTPSLQTLHTVLPLAQLRKASSVQSLERRTERSTILGEVQIPYGLAPLGRVTQAFPDGSLLLELIKPPNGPFGFVISRGKGRPDTVYVEKVGDGSGEGPYVGLLGVGDEILQVNGEAVAGLSLDQVTRLMTRDNTASLRILPARRNQR
uniref:Si:ch211-13f8.1 n=1 Tax=Oryzias melastigma TaxID=30732 RepID=A0A3B3CDY1_ORYME